MKVLKLKTTLLAFALAVFSLSFSTTVAAEKEGMKEAPGNIASIWLLWPKAGEAANFEKAIKAHAAWRKTAGEGMFWEIYQPIVGNDLGHYAVRTGGHHWKDFDSGDAWHKAKDAGKAYNDQVGQYVDRAEHYFTETDNEDSNWIDSNDYRFFGVSEYYSKPGMGGDREEAIKKVHKAVSDAKWKYPYTINYVIGGDDRLQIVTPMKSYAEMADPDPSMMKIMTTTMGSEEAARAVFKQFGSSNERSTYSVYEYRPDLSTPQ